MFPGCGSVGKRKKQVRYSGVLGSSKKRSHKRKFSSLTGMEKSGFKNGSEVMATDQGELELDESYLHTYNEAKSCIAYLPNPYVNALSSFLPNNFDSGLSASIPLLAISSLALDSGTPLR
jgi:hypothetical protein